MIQSKKNPSIKTLSKKEQKAIVGGTCSDGSYPIYCPELGRKVCPAVCFLV